jgi:DNA-binding SARP family transcriptional activator/Flp pilus assembly protein TadD
LARTPSYHAEQGDLRAAIGSPGSWPFRFLHRWAGLCWLPALVPMADDACVPGLGVLGGGVVVLEFGVLGPVRAVRDGRELGLGGPKPRAVLALLLVDAGRVVPSEYLAEVLWRGSPPPGAAKTLRSYVSRLRTVVGPEAALMAQGGGYAIVVEPDRVDAARFERLVGAARDALGRGEAAAAAGRFGEALALWRGRALADVSEVEPLALEATRLEELRLVALEGRIEADIERGVAGEVTGELERLVAEYPVRERLWRLLVLALYRAERQADALAAYRRARQMLAEELGIEPGEELRQLEGAVLRREVPPPATAAVTRTLPRDVASFTGRGAELGRLLGDLAAAATGGVVGICAIGGMAGIGKTTLAVHAAHRLVERFPDGQLFLPLHAHTPGQRPVDPADALASLLLAAGVGARQIPPGVEARAARWRDYLAGKKVLLVLDDTSGHEQVRPLLPGTAGSLVLITSRRRLAALEDATVISLDTLAPDEAAELLARLAGWPDLGAGDAGVGEIARLCGYLPLAIGMVASQLRHHPAWTTVGLAADLAAARDRLGVMRAENLSVAAAFDLSYQDLTSDQQRLFRRLGLHPGPDIDACAAAALDGTTTETARRGLEGLYGQHLITEPTPGRYRLHDLLREHARSLAASDDPATCEAAAGRLLDYYLHAALAAGSHIPPQRITSVSLPPARPPDCAPPIATQSQASSWLEAERANLSAAAGYAAATGRTQHAMVIPAVITGFLNLGGYWDQDVALLQTAVAAARQAGDRPSQGQLLLLLGLAQWMTDDVAGATATLRQALALYRDLGDPAGQGDAINGIGYVCLITNDYPAATASLRQALELCRSIGHRLGQANALSGLGTVYRLTGNYPAAATSLQQALELFRGIGHRAGEYDALSELAIVQTLTGDYPAAATTFEHVLALQRDAGDRFGQAFMLRELGRLQRLTGDYRAAAASQQQALAEFRDLGARTNQPDALNELGLVQQLTGDYAAAAISHQQALEISGDTGERQCQAESLNGLGELATRTAATQQARDYHTQALAIARDLGAFQEEARAIEGIGRAHLHDGHTGEGTTHLRQALALYQRIEAPDARRVQDALTAHRTRKTSQAAGPKH